MTCCIVSFRLGQTWILLRMYLYYLCEISFHFILFCGVVFLTVFVTASNVNRGKTGGLMCKLDEMRATLELNPFFTKV